MSTEARELTNPELLADTIQAARTLITKCYGADINEDFVRERVEFAKSQVNRGYSLSLLVRFLIENATDNADNGLGEPRLIIVDYVPNTLGIVRKLEEEVPPEDQQLNITEELKILSSAEFNESIRTNNIRKELKNQSRTGTSQEFTTLVKEEYEHETLAIAFSGYIARIHQLKREIAFDN